MSDENLAAQEALVVEGLLVKAPPQRVRIILAPYCLEFDCDDVVSIIELPLPEQIIPGRAIAVRVELVACARLLRIALADSYDAFLWKRPVPFGIATRRPPTLENQQRIRQLEEAFKSANGLGRQS
jgi:hypothetical protein